MQSPFSCGSKFATTPLREMTKIQSFTRRECFGSLQQQMVLQDVECRAIYSLGFFFAPLPKLAQNRGSLSIHFPGTGNAPGFIFIPNSLDKGLLESTLTRLAKPLQASSLLQCRLQLLCQRQEI